MTKIVLLGDSIRLIGYGKKVPSLLGDRYEVWQPNDNCRFAQYTLRGMFDWRERLEGTDIVHWNNGLWDICDLFGDGAFTSKEDYVKTMLRIADILLSKSKKVIFATTTPVDSTHPYNRNERIIEYNEAIVPSLLARGIQINDLHTLVNQDVDTYICEDKIHLSEAGIDLCSDAVVKAIHLAERSLS